MRYRLNPSKEPITMHELVAARIPGRPLPGPLYVSQQAFDLDLDAIFGRHWIFVPSEPEIPAPASCFNCGKFTGFGGNLLTPRGALKSGAD